jgi:alanine dehydrogenase
MAGTTQWLSEHDVAAALDLGTAIDTLRQAFAQEGAGCAHAMEKTMLGFGGHSTLHALGAALPGEQLAGTKTWVHTPGGADPVLLLFDATTGSLRAVMEAFALGQLRTAGTTALATDLLARPDATRFAIIGTGRQAMAQAAGVATVRPIKGIRAYSRDPGRCAAFSYRVAEELGVPCQPAGSAAEAADGADIVILVTRATSPVLTGQMVKAGMHINAIGAIDLQRREFEPAILGRCSMVVTDSLPQARNFSSEFREHYGSAENAWPVVRTLGEAVAARYPQRDVSAVTLFKGMGSGLADVALGAAVLARAGSGERAVMIQRQGRGSIHLAGRTSVRYR